METLSTPVLIASSDMGTNESPGPLTKVVADNVAEVTKSLGFSHTEAAAGKVDKKTYNNVAKGRHSPQLKSIGQVAAALDVEAWQLLLEKIPSTPKDRNALADIVHYYLNLEDEDARESILRTAEVEAKNAGIYRKRPKRPLSDGGHDAVNSKLAASSRNTAY